MRTGRKFLAFWMVGCFLVVLGKVRVQGDLITSGFHGVRVFDERTGAFRLKTGVGEEQEGIAFAPNGELYVLINDLGGGWIAQFAPRSYRWDWSFGPHDFTGMPLGMTTGPDGDLYIGG